MSNDDLMVIFVLIGQATFLFCDTCHLQMVLLIAISVSGGTTIKILVKFKKHVFSYYMTD